MERLEANYSKDFGQLLLYLEDLDRICEMLSQDGHRLEIVADDYRLINAEEFRKLKTNTLSELKIISHVAGKGGYVNSVTLQLYRSKNGSLSADDPSQAMRGLCAQVEEFLNRHKRLPSPVFRLLISIAVAVCMFFLSYFSGIPLVYNGPRQWHFGDTLTACVFCGLFIFVLLLMFIPIPIANIVLKERQHHQGFIKRHWESVVVAVISSALTTVVVVPITIMISRAFTPNNERVQQPPPTTKPSTNP